MRAKKLLVPASLALLTACAEPPEEIIPAAVPQGQFMRTGCAELAILVDMKRKDLSTLEEQQRGVAEEDRNSMWAVHVPMGSLRGNDKGDEIALVKGEVRSITDAQRAKRCPAA